MIIGIDLDNTIVNYDSVFQKIAGEEGIAISSDKTPKRAVQSDLREKPDGEWLWSLLQGEVYGPRIMDANPYTDLLPALSSLKSHGHQLFVISHKTSYPTVGEPHQLQEWARKWIEQHLPELINSQSVFLNESKSDKLDCIRRLNCDLFIDDLESILEDPRFPQTTEPLLFRPDDSSEHPKFRVLNAWADLPALIKDHRSSNTSKTLERYISDTSPLTRIQDFISKWPKSKLHELGGGRNNEVFRASREDQQNCVIKAYAQSPSDTRDRYHHETAFLKHAQSLPIQCLPEVIDTDPEKGLAVFEYIPGTLASQAPVLGDWDQCLQFLEQLQNTRDYQTATAIPLAAEASLTFQEHLDHITPRRNFWLNAASRGNSGSKWKIWIQNQLEPIFQKLAKTLICHPEFKTKLPLASLIISPSDFGLHNAIRKKDGTLVFIDFEYAGWDDPAKTLSDFFLQPRASPPQTLFSQWKRSIEMLLPEDQRTSFNNRLPYVQACCALKWIYIILKNRLDPETLNQKLGDTQTKRALDSLGERLKDLTTKILPSYV